MSIYANKYHRKKQADPAYRKMKADRMRAWRLKNKKRYTAYMRAYRLKQRKKTT